MHGGMYVDCRRRLKVILCTILIVPASATAVLGQDDRVTQSAMTGNGKGSLPSFPETTAEPSQDAGSADLGFGQPRCCPRWTAAADFIILDRIGSVPYTLVETVPAGQSPKYAGTEVLDARDLHEGFSGGPRLDLIHLGEDGNDLEVSYFQIDGWDSYRGIGPTPDGLLVSLGQIAETSCHYSLTLRTHTCRHWGSIAAPTSFITGPPPAWSIRSSGASTETCNVILLGRIGHVVHSEFGAEECRTDALNRSLCGCQGSPFKWRIRLVVAVVSFAPHFHEFSGR